MQDDTAFGAGASLGCETPTTQLALLSVAASPQLSAVMSWLPGLPPPPHSTQSLSHFVHSLILILKHSQSRTHCSHLYLLVHLSPSLPTSLLFTLTNGRTSALLVTVLHTSRMQSAVSILLEADSVSLCDWTLVYSSQVHRRGLETFYSYTKALGPTLLLVHTQARACNGPRCAGN